MKTTVCTIATRRVLLLIALLGTILQTDAKIKLPSLIADNMVLQQQSKVKLWGMAKPNTKVTVSPSWSKIPQSTTSDSKGQWLVSVETPVAGGPYHIRFNDGEILDVNNVLIGEVWVCSGQSNMYMPVKGMYGQPVIGSNEVILRADPKTPVRLFAVEKTASKHPLDDCVGAWGENTSEKVADFSATAYFFGTYLQEVLHVPVGLIHTSWGGANIQSWMSPESLSHFPEISLSHLSDDSQVKSPNHSPSMLYNAMMHPLLNYGIKGMIWYQGESNNNRPEQYGRLLPAFVEDLRHQFGQGEFPFYYVQIAPHGDDKEIGSALLREAQMKCAKRITRSGMAVIMDIGEQKGIHPPQKELVGRRLAYWALGDTYGRRVSYASPEYESMQVNANKIVLSFRNAEDGLTSYYKELANFEIAGEDKVFHPAKARIITGKGTIEVWNEKVSKPVAARYAFKSYAKGDLFNTYGLPVSSFRTDEGE